MSAQPTDQPTAATLDPGTAPVVLAIGDVVGRVGRRALAQVLPQLRAEHAATLVVVNGENASGGIGINARAVGELFQAGADVITLGNHSYRQSDVHRLLDARAELLRPINHLPSQPGHGVCVIERGGLRFGVVNVQGNVFMETGGHAFTAIDAALAGLDGLVDHVLVDFHAEATSEKIAMGWHLDGRVSAVWGTHTHVPTADQRVLVSGTAYITDLGMTGSRDGVIGMQREPSLRKFVTHMHQRFEPAEKDPWLMGAVITLDPAAPRALAIESLLVPA